MERDLKRRYQFQNIIHHQSQVPSFLLFSGVFGWSRTCFLKLTHEWTIEVDEPNLLHPRKLKKGGFVQRFFKLLSHMELQVELSPRSAVLVQPRFFESIFCCFYAYWNWVVSLTLRKTRRKNLSTEVGRFAVKCSFHNCEESFLNILFIESSWIFQKVLPKKWSHLFDILWQSPISHFNLYKWSNFCWLNDLQIHQVWSLAVEPV